MPLISNLFHLIYASKEKHKFSQDNIVELLSKAKKQNESLNIHGMLLYDEGSFFQVLEGEKEVVLDLYDRIVNDERHQNVTKIIFEAIPDMYFSNWSMGYSSLSRSELEKIEGMNDFFIGQACLADIDAGRARKLLKVFSNGRWHLS